MEKKKNQLAISNVAKCTPLTSLKNRRKSVYFALLLKICKPNKIELVTVPAAQAVRLVEFFLGPVAPFPCSLECTVSRVPSVASCETV